MVFQHHHLGTLHGGGTYVRPLSSGTIAAHWKSLCLVKVSVIEIPNVNEVWWTSPVRYKHPGSPPHIWKEETKGARETAIHPRIKRPDTFCSHQNCTDAPLLVHLLLHKLETTDQNKRATCDGVLKVLLLHYQTRIPDLMLTYITHHWILKLAAHLCLCCIYNSKWKEQPELLKPANTGVLAFKANRVLNLTPPGSYLLSCWIQYNLQTIVNASINSVHRFQTVMICPGLERRPAFISRCSSIK